MIQIEKYYAIDTDISVINKWVISQYSPIFTVINLTSKEASKVVQNNLDLVFIDASHNYESVKEDINLWLPKVKKGGILCGHDYGDIRGCREVKKAVDEVLGEVNLEKDVLREGNIKIWWIKK